MGKRVFIGIKIKPELFPMIDEWRRAYSDLPVRFIADDNLHITLIPPWYEDKKAISDKIEEIKRIRGLKRFYIKLRRVCFGPTLKGPRLIWAEGEVPEELLLLISRLEKTLHKMPEKRIYKLHLTLARFNVRNYKMFPIRKLNDNILWKQIVSSFCLFESKLSSRGAEYKVIREFVY